MDPQKDGRSKSSGKSASEGQRLSLKERRQDQALAATLARPLAALGAVSYTHLTLPTILLV
eukprot:2584758-Pleurochrysis_carterae.AAC.5